MSKQQDAPGELEQVRAFINTADIEQGTERLASPADLTAWLQAAGLLEPGAPAQPSDLERTLRLREALRAILMPHTTGEEVAAEHAAALDDAATRARVRLHFDKRGAVRLAPEANGIDGALGRLLAIVQAAEAEGTWPRLKACRDDGCAWAFYDHTKNRSGTWCNMQVCGNRAKARSYRERRGQPATAAD